VSPSSSLLARLRGRPASDEGFTLAEVITALMIFGVIAAALIPMLISATRLATIAKLSTQAKQLAVERIESMRNLPYYVAFDNGQYRDILDVYFRDLQAAGALEANDPCTARAYIAASSTYRCTINPISGYAKFRQQIEVQFLTAERVVVVPRATYNARLSNMDIPISSLLGITVTTSWDAPGGAKSSVLRTEIANSSPAARQVVSAAGATALKVASTLSSGQVVQLQAGMFNADGALSTAASAAHSTVGAQAGYLSGTTVQGAAVSASAPADENGGSAGAGTKRLDAGSCFPVCFGNSSVTGDTWSRVSTGLPLVSASGSPAEGRLLRSDVSDEGGVAYSNATLGEQDSALMLSTSRPMVFFTDGSSGDITAQGSGYLTATKNPNSVRAHASAFTRRLRVLPTSFAPDGLVRVRLNSASIDCNNVAAAGGVTAAWDVTVSWYSPGAPSGYASLTLTQSSASGLPDPSTIVVLSDNPVTIGVDESRRLSHWIDSWSGMFSGSPVVESTGRLARGSLPAVFSVTTKPTRGAADPASALGVEVGVLTCMAEDLR
jgi:prepilin-type N-terminal cleavage/methylation domain-containing protein